MIIWDAGKFTQNAIKFVQNAGKFAKNTDKFLENKNLKKSNKDYGTLVNLVKMLVRKELLTSIFSKDTDKKEFFCHFFRTLLYIYIYIKFKFIIL